MFLNSNSLIIIAYPIFNFKNLTMNLKSNLFFVGFLLSIALHAQPQWKFPIAFEDGTGARDTIWCIWDSAATGGILGQFDSLLHEGPFPFDYSVFNVWITNENYDSTKTLAFPFNYSLSIAVNAFNYQYPITISWDSSLFHAPGLPLPVGYVNRAVIDNDYFFLINNDPPLQKFNMILDNSVLAPSFLWGSQSQFPFFIGIERDPSLGMAEGVRFNNNELTLFPNPCNKIINFNSDNIFESYSILNNVGKLVKSGEFTTFENNLYSIPLTGLESGFYNLFLINSKKRTYYEKLIITH